MELKNIKDHIVFNEKSLTKKIIFSTKETLCFVLNFTAGQTLPAHKHENSGLVFHVLSGSGEIKINDQVSKITTGSVGYAEGQDDFSIPSISEDLSLFVVISPNPSNEIYSKSFG